MSILYGKRVKCLSDGKEGIVVGEETMESHYLSKKWDVLIDLDDGTDRKLRREEIEVLQDG
jgi:hypothetical protein